MLGVAVHWEAAAPRADHSQCAAQVEDIRRLHDSKGYAPGTAYNWLACTHGGIFEGRGWGRVSGANGTSWANLNFWAVCMMTGPGQPHPPELFTAVGELVREGIRRALDDVRPHSAFFNTACCGDIGREWIAARGWTTGTLPPPPEEDDMQGRLYVDGKGTVWYVNGGGVSRTPLKTYDDVDFLAREGWVDSHVPKKATPQQLRQWPDLRSFIQKLSTPATK